MMRPRPIEHLEAVSRDYPGVWRAYDGILASRGRDVPDWPSWCFAPLAAAFAVVSGGEDIVDPRKVLDVGRVGALAAWRPTQGIYRFDPTLLEQLRATPISGDLPVEHLQRLPEWCVYVELPFDDWGLFGFFAHLESDEDDRVELRIVVDLPSGLLSLPLHLVGSLPECIAAAQEAALENGAPSAVASTRESLTSRLAPLISVLLYLCSEDAEMRPTRGRGPVRPAMKRSKDGEPRMPPAKALEVWETGYGLGALLRDAIARNEEGGGSVRPHVRRAHWHSYWRGEGRSERIVKWLSPILVGGGPEKATVRSVR